MTLERTFPAQPARRRLLFLAHRVPFPPDKGDRIRSLQMLTWLTSRHDVWLGCLADEPWTPDTEAHLRQLCVEVKIAPLTRRRWLHGAASLLSGGPVTLGMFECAELRRWIRAVTARTPFDGVVVFCSNMAGYTRMRELRRLPLLVDLVDVDSAKWRDYAERSTGLLRRLYRREARCLEAVERDLGHRAHAITLTTPVERELYHKHAPGSPSYVVGNGVDIDFFHRPENCAPSAREVVFVGAMDYRPNVDGMLWFCRHVWPEVRARLPDAVLRIVGRRPTPAILALSQQPGITIHADVPDVRQYLISARLAVVPLHVARGVQNKVLEALACETPVVASPAALRGLHPALTDEALSADTAADWIGAVVQLLQDDAACQRMARSGRQYVEQHCRWEQRLAPLGQLLTSMVPERRGTIPHDLPVAVIPA